MTPLRVIVTGLDHGGRRVELRCPCLKVGRILTSWEPIEEAVHDMLEEHRRLAPRCQHPALGASPR